MKCPKCGNKQRARDGMDCTCGYRFVFDPRAEQGLTDGKFLSYVKKASGDGSHRFTPHQLYAAYCQKNEGVRPRTLFILWIALVLGALAAGFFSFLLTVFLLMAAGVAFLAWTWRLIEVHWMDAPAEDAIGGPLRTWLGESGRGVGMRIDSLLREPQLDTPPPGYQEQDIYAYGVERVLVVQRDVLVDLFVRNNFHADQRALILSASGYPAYLLPVAEKLLQEAPDLPVFLLHDSDHAGMKMAGKRLGGLEVDDAGPPHPERRPVIDLGLSPLDVKRMPGLRAIKPAKRDYAIPVDMIPYAALSGMVAEAMERRQSFSEILTLAAQEGRGSTFGGHVTGFG